MTQIAKVLLKSTSGDEFSCSVHYERSSGLVMLPARVDSLVDASTALGERHVLLLLEDGYQYPLIREEGPTYRVDRASVAKRGWLQEVRMAVKTPSKDQRLQYGRLAHTLSAAATIGSVTYLSGARVWNLTTIGNSACLFLMAGVLFVVGAVLSKGDK